MARGRHPARAGKLTRAGDAQKRSRTGDAQKRSDASDAQKRSGTGDARKRSRTGDAQKQSRTGDAQKQSRTGDAQKQSRTGDAQKRSRTGDAQKRSRAGGAQKRSRTGDAQKRNRAGGAQERSRPASAQEKSRVTGAQESGAPARAPGPRGVPAALSRVGAEPHPGMWIFTTREGAEQDLVDELLLAKVIDPAARVLGPALVLSPKLPKREGRPLELTFARQGFEIVQSVKSHDLDEITARTARSLRHQLARDEQYALHVWVPDSRDGNPLSALADELDARLEAALSGLRRVDDASLRRLASVKLAQVCLIDTERAVAGVMHNNRTPSLARGGRTRVRVTGDFPSRAARKVEEALAWLGVAPTAGELCVDLGAAPGGWTFVLAERRARVIAVDPAKLRPEILARKNVRHVAESAFTFSPDEPVDWLFCDMAWRPLEVAALLAKWGRKRWARIVVANIKLPMTKKAELLARVRGILESEGDWNHVRTKQLYHDRDEITLTALRT